MSVYIKPEFQIQRINELERRLTAWGTNNAEVWTKRPNSKSWSAIEVVQHMIIAHKVYKMKIEGALQSKLGGETQTEFKASFMPSFLIKRFPPKEGKIRFKMKTSKQFKPLFKVEALNEMEIRNILSEISKSLAELKSWVEQYRMHTIDMKKFNSAIGPMVRFNAPEACEFILCHNERHFLQVDRTLAN